MPKPEARFNPTRRLVRRAALAAATIAVTLTVLPSAPPTARAADAPAATDAAGRQPDEIQKDLNETGKAIAEVMPGMDAMAEASKRAELAPKVVPLMRKMTNLLGEMVVVRPGVKQQVAQVQMEMRGLMAMLGDKQADDELAKLSVSPDEGEAAASKSWSVLARWVKARPDPAAQEKLALELAAIARDQPRNEMVAQTASMMTDSAATPALAEQVEKVVTGTLKGEMAEQVGKSMGARRRLNTLVGQPLVVEGPTVDGKPFTTAPWKGKVVLVDFWATWCPPCMAELPAIKKVYADYHDKGLEIVSLSSDRDADALKAHLAKDKEMAWPQMFDPGKTEWHPLAEKFGVEQLPTMFVIDRKGVVRTVKGDREYKELIPKLLAEKE